ncbi:MAG: hypothetical protein ACJA2Q_000945 [Pseudohongiellaceae bacterium]|jgi:hypothetical protein
MPLALAISSASDSAIGVEAWLEASSIAVSGADSPQAASSVKRKENAVNLNGAERFIVVKVIVVNAIVVKVPVVKVLVIKIIAKRLWCLDNHFKKEAIALSNAVEIETYHFGFQTNISSLGN